MVQFFDCTKEHASENFSNNIDDELLSIKQSIEELLTFVIAIYMMNHAK